MTSAFWRAFLSCWHPRVLLWSLAPLLFAASLVGALGWWFWEAALDSVRAGIDSFELAPEVLRWLDAMGGRSLRTLIGPIVVVSLSVPVVMLLSLLLVALLVAPHLAAHVAQRHVPGLQALHGASWTRMAARTLVCAAIALLALVLSLPLWLIPPLVLLVPWLIWSWLASRVMAYAALGAYASAEERRVLLHRKRWSLWGMGLVCGVLASLPSLLWTAGAPALVAAPVLGPLLVWLYTAIFVFAALWFAHFLLPALHSIRDAPAVRPATRIEPPLEAASGAAPVSAASVTCKEDPPA